MSSNKLLTFLFLAYENILTQKKAKVKQKFAKIKLQINYIKIINRLHILKKKIYII